MMEDLGGKTSEAEMNIGSDPISTPRNDINTNPPEIMTVATLADVCQPEDSRVEGESESCRECGQLLENMNILKEDHYNILSEMNMLHRADRIIQEKKRNVVIRNRDVRDVRAEWEEIKFVERCVNRKRLYLIYEEKNTRIQIDSYKQEIYHKVMSILNRNKAKLKQIKNRLDGLETKILDFFVKKPNGIAWYISFRDIPDTNWKNKSEEYFAAEEEASQEKHEELKAAVFCPMHKMIMENALENGENQGKITENHRENEKDLTLANTKITHDSPIANEFTNPLPKLNQKDLVIDEPKEDV